MTNDERDVRFAAQSMYQNMYRSHPPIDFSRSQSHSINFITEDFLAGYMEDGRRMSVVRRFFCLFVTFDLFFISLLWLICILVSIVITSNENLVDNSVFPFRSLATTFIMHNQYTIYASLFDIVMAAVCRFTVLILFYALLYINHWIIIALSTSGSCAFLIAKVFFFNWVDSPQPVFQVLLIVTSFVLSWGEAWFLDCRVIPQEKLARNYMTAAMPHLNDDRSPLLAPFLNSAMPPERIANFYSPYDSCHNSEDEEDQDEDYRSMGKECVRKAYRILETSTWSVEKVTAKGDTIQSTQRDKLGKVFRLTARIQFPAKQLLEHLFYKIEEIPKWNPTILESKIIRKIDTHTDISYQATASAGSGIIKSRDFVNLRCWHVCRDGNIIDADDESEECAGSVPTLPSFRKEDSDDECILSSDTKQTMHKSLSDARINEGKQKSAPVTGTLSKSLGAKGFFEDELHSGDEKFEDAENDDKSSIGSESMCKPSGKVYVSAAISVPYSVVPPSTKFTRGENLLSCWAMRELDGKSDSCIFEWLLCLDLKGYFPRRLLDATYTTFMQDYMIYLRKYCAEVKRRKSHRHQDEDYRSMGKECVRKAYRILETSTWSVEKVTAKGDTIQSTQRDKLGKVFRLTARIKFPAKQLLEHLFYKIEEIPKWNPTILESKIIRKIDTHTDISYQATASAGSGIIKSRDFVNLRCWHVCRDGNIIDADDESEECAGSVPTLPSFRKEDSDDECILSSDTKQTMHKSLSDARINEGKQKSAPVTGTLSKSLGAKGFFEDELHSGDEKFEDAENDDKSSIGSESMCKPSGKVYVSAAISVPYSVVPPSTKFTRGENLLSCWAMRELDGKSDSCIFEWLLCLDLKGYFPRRLLDATYTTFMQDYMIYLRKYCAEVKRRKSHRHQVNS